MTIAIDKDTFVLTTADLDKKDTPVIAVSGLHPYSRMNRNQLKIILKFLLSYVDPNIGKWSYDNFQNGKKYQVTVKEIKKK